MQHVTDYRAEFPGVEPITRWVLPNPMHGYTPILAQGFLGVFDGRPDDYWFPAVGYTTTLEHTYTWLEDARDAALARINSAIARLQAQRAEVLAVRG